MLTRYAGYLASPTGTAQRRRRLEETGMARAEHRQLLDVIDRLYAASLDHSQWPVFLGSLASMFEAKNAFICEVDHRTRALDYVGLSQQNRERVPVKRYETLINEDPRTPLFRRHLSRATHCRMGLSTERLHASRAYREYLQPLDFEYTMVVLLPVRDGVTLDLGLTRGRSSEAFGGDDCDLLNELVPHLGRGFEIRRALSTRLAPQLPLVAQSESDTEMLQRLLSLTPSQARLTRLLFDGLTVKDAAERLGLTEGTARQYIKRIYARIGVRRQTDMIRRVGRALSER
jgi:DNA-binding CsgD family transcriptional regulator